MCGEVEHGGARAGRAVFYRTAPGEEAQHCFRRQHTRQHAGQPITGAALSLPARNGLLDTVVHTAHVPGRKAQPPATVSSTEAHSSHPPPHTGARRCDILRQSWDARCYDTHLLGPPACGE